jgi:hypothetical protein
MNDSIATSNSFISNLKKTAAALIDIYGFFWMSRCVIKGLDNTMQCPPERDKFWMGLSAASDQLSANSLV